MEVTFTKLPNLNQNMYKKPTKDHKKLLKQDDKNKKSTSLTNYITNWIQFTGLLSALKKLHVTE